MLLYGGEAGICSATCLPAFATLPAIPQRSTVEMNKESEVVIQSETGPDNMPSFTPILSIGDAAAGRSDRGNSPEFL